MPPAPGLSYVASHPTLSKRGMMLLVLLRAAASTVTLLPQSQRPAKLTQKPCSAHPVFQRTISFRFRMVWRSRLVMPGSHAVKLTRRTGPPALSAFSVEAMEASMEAWKLPWKLPRHGRVEASTEVTSTSFRESFHDGYFHGNFHASLRGSKLLSRRLSRKLSWK